MPFAGSGVVWLSPVSAEYVRPKIEVCWSQLSHPEANPRHAQTHRMLKVTARPPWVTVPVQQRRVHSTGKVKTAVVRPIKSALTGERWAWKRSWTGSGVLATAARVLHRPAVGLAARDGGARGPTRETGGLSADRRSWIEPSVTGRVIPLCPVLGFTYVTGGTLTGTPLRDNPAIRIDFLM